MCSKPKKLVEKLVLSDRTRIEASSPDELAAKLAERFKGTPTEFKIALKTPLDQHDLLLSEDDKGSFYESKSARERRLTEPSRSPKQGYRNVPSPVMVGGAR